MAYVCTKFAFIQQINPMNHVIYALILNVVGILLFANGFFLTRVELPDIATCNNSGSRDMTQDSIQLSDNKGCCYPWKQHELPLMAHSSSGTHSSNTKEKTSKHECSSYDRIVILIIDALRYDFMDPDSEIISKDYHSHQAESGNINVNDASHTMVYHNKLKFVAKTLKEKANKSFLRKFLADPPTTTMQRLKGVFTGGLPTFIDIKDDVASSAITEDNLLLQLIRKKMEMVFMGDDTWVALFPNAFKRSFPYPSFNVKDLHTVDLGVIDHLFPELRNKDWDVLVGHFLGVDHVGHRYGPDHIEMGLKLTQMDHAIEDVINEIEKRSQNENERILLLVFGDHGMTGDGNHGGATDLERGAALFAYSTYPIFDSSPINGKYNKDNIVDLFINESQGGNIQQIDLAPTLSMLMDIPIPFGNLGSVIPELMFGTLSNDVDEDQRLEKVNRALKANIDQVITYFEEYSSKAKGSLNMEKVKTLKQMANDLSKNATLSKREVFLSSRSILRILADDARALWTQFDTTMMILGIILLFVSCLVLSYPCFLLIRKMIQQNTDNGDQLHLSPFTGLITVLLSYAALFSNSYIVAEAHVFSFLCCTFALSLGAECISSLKGKEFSKKDDIHSGSQYFLSLSSVTRILLITFFVMLCSRLSLETGDAIRAAAHEAASMELNQICFQMICWLLVSLFCFRFFDFSMVSFSSLLLPISHWLLQYINHPMLLVPRISFAACILSVGTHLIRPAYVSKGSIFISLVSSYSLLLGPASPAAILLALCQCSGFYYLVHCLDDHNIHTDTTSSSKSVKLSFLTATYLYLSSCLFFFSSGHKCDFGTLHITSAYVGFEEFAYYRGAVMLTLNTFGNYLFPVLAHLLHLVSYKDGTDDDIAKVSILAYLFSIRTTATATFVHFQRRHLMVWAIFAPKLVYDASSLLFLDGTVLIYYMVKRLALHAKEKHHRS